MFTLGELADRLGLAFTGDGERRLSALASLATAGPHDLSFHDGARHLDALRATRAGAVILHPDHAHDCPADQLLASDPYLAFARVTALFAPPASGTPGIHPSATIADSASIAPGASIGPHAVVEAAASVAAGASLGAGCYLGPGSRIDEDTRVHPGAVIYRNVHIGRGCTIHARAVIGSDGFGFARDRDGWEKIHQLGGVRIGDGVEIGAGTTIDCGTLDDTVIADGVIIDNQVQVGHNCRIGPGTAIAGCVGLAGSTVIGANCTLAGGVGVVGHVEICDNVHVTGMTMVTRSITAPGSYSSGTPMAVTADWKRNAVRFGQLDAIVRRLDGRRGAGGGDDASESGNGLEDDGTG